MRENAGHDGGVVDRGEQLHLAGTARTAQDVQVERPAHAAPFVRLGSVTFFTYRSVLKLCRRTPSQISPASWVMYGSTAARDTGGRGTPPGSGLGRWLGVIALRRSWVPR